METQTQAQRQEHQQRRSALPTPSNTPRQQKQAEPVAAGHKVGAAGSVLSPRKTRAALAGRKATTATQKPQWVGAGAAAKPRRQQAAKENL